MAMEMSKLRLWFFRDISSEQRTKLFLLAGVPADGTETHATQRMIFDKLFAALNATPQDGKGGEE